MEKTLESGQSLADILSRRRTTVMWSQSNLQPLQQNIQPGFQQNIFIQPSRQFMNLAKQKLYFRPVIQCGVDNGLPDLARKQMLGATPIDSASVWTLQSFCINGAQVLSQSQSQLQRTRSIFQAYYNSMTAKPKKKKLTGSTSVAGQAFSGTCGTTLQGFQKNIPTHPASHLGTASNANQGGVSSSLFEGLEYSVVGVNTPANPATNGQLTATTNYFPRAIISRHKIINPDFNYVPFGNGTNAATVGGVGNYYMAGQVSVNGDAVPPTAMGQANAANAGQIAFPMLPRSTTPSVNIYMAQQERFEEMRRRFLTQIVSIYHAPFTCQTITGGAGNLNNNQTATIQPSGASGAGAVGISELQEQYCQSVQNGVYAYAGGSAQSIGVPGSIATTTVGTSTARQFSSLTSSWAAGTENPLYVPAELYTQLEVSLGELSMEIDQLGEICLENAQIQIQLQANLPQNVLSAFLQPSLFASGINSGQALASSSGPSTAQCAAYLQACTLGSFTYQCTDMIMRLEYIDYPSESYEIVKKYHMAPKPYMSLRQQLDPIPVDVQGTFTQRIAINNPIVLAFVSFIVPTNNNKPTYIPASGQATTPLPQDTVVNYLGCNPLTDLRGTYLDSYSMNLTSYYIDDGSGRRFESNDVNIANGQYSTYLRSMDGLQTAFNRYLDIDFSEWVQNRAVICIPFNVNADPQLALTSSQVILSLTFENSARVESSRLYGECNTSLTNQFSLLTFAVTAQSLVDCSFVRV